MKREYIYPYPWNKSKERFDRQPPNLSIAKNHPLKHRVGQDKTVFRAAEGIPTWSGVLSGAAPE